MILLTQKENYYFTTYLVILLVWYIMTDEAPNEGLLYYSYYSSYEPHHDKTNKVSCASRKETSLDITAV